MTSKSCWPTAIAGRWRLLPTCGTKPCTDNLCREFVVIISCKESYCHAQEEHLAQYDLHDGDATPAVIGSSRGPNCGQPVSTNIVWQQGHGWPHKGEQIAHRG